MTSIAHKITHSLSPPTGFNSFKEFPEIENANGTQFSANPPNGISLLNRPKLELQIGILQIVIGKSPSTQKSGFLVYFPSNFFLHAACIECAKILQGANHRTRPCYSILFQCTSAKLFLQVDSYFSMLCRYTISPKIDFLKNLERTGELFLIGYI